MHIGRLHVVLLHFPIALACAAVLAEALRLVFRKEWFCRCALYCLTLAAIAAVPVVVMGLVTAGSQEFVGDYVSILVRHRFAGIAFAVIAVAAAGVRLSHPDHIRGWCLEEVLPETGTSTCAIGTRYRASYYPWG